MKKVLSVACIALILATLFVPIVSASDNTGFLFDNTSLLSDSEASAVEEALAAPSEKYGVDVIILTVNDFEEFFSENYNENFYDINDAAEYLCKDVLPNKNNVVLMVSMAYRDWCIASNEKGHDAFTAYGREYIGNEVTEYLSDGDYEEAFLKFSELADEFLAEAEKGTPYDTNHKRMTLTDYLIRFGIPLGAGLIIAFIVTMVIRQKYKPVHLKAEANDYLIPGSLQVHNAYDHFIYTHVSRTRKAKSNSSGSDRGSFGSTSGKF